MGFKGFVLFLSVSGNLFGLLVEGEDLEINWKVYFGVDKVNF